VLLRFASVKGIAGFPLHTQINPKEYTAVEFDNALFHQ